jgi:6-phosphofructokinase 1
MAMTYKKIPGKICIVVSGGDAPGMNACVEAIFNYAMHLGMQVHVAIAGYQGLVNNVIVEATREKCNNISHQAGCVYRCARCPEFKTAEGFNAAMNTIISHAFDALVVIGGNGTLMGLEALKRAGINVIGIPATIDNDVFFTKNSLGFSSACEAIVQELDMVKATMGTHERNFLVTVMGRHCNELALKTGVASFANMIDIEERRHAPVEIAKLFVEQRAKGNMSCMTLLQENRPDAATLHGEVKALAQDGNLREDVLGYFQRGAPPSCHDRFLGAHYGVIAVDHIKNRKFGVVIGQINDEFVSVNLETANRATHKFDKANFDLIGKISNR